MQADSRGYRWRGNLRLRLALELSAKEMLELQQTVVSFAESEFAKGTELEVVFCKMVKALVSGGLGLATSSLLWRTESVMPILEPFSVPFPSESSLIRS